MIFTKWVPEAAGTSAYNLLQIINSSSVWTFRLSVFRHSGTSLLGFSFIQPIICHLAANQTYFPEFHNSCQIILTFDVLCHSLVVLQTTKMWFIEIMVYICLWCGIESYISSSSKQSVHLPVCSYSVVKRNRPAARTESFLTMVSLLFSLSLSLSILTMQFVFYFLVVAWV